MKGFTRRSLHPENSTPKPQKGGYPAPNRVTFLTGTNRDFPIWRRHGEAQTGEEAMAPIRVPIRLLDFGWRDSSGFGVP
jgi:hypothetical protein